MATYAVAIFAYTYMGFSVKKTAYPISRSRIDAGLCEFLK